MAHMESSSACKVSLRVYSTWMLLKFTYGLACIIVGLDKFFNLIVEWGKYVHPTITANLPLYPQHFMYAVGITEIVVGVLIISRWTRLGAFLAFAWLVVIIMDLFALKLYDIALRDAVMAVGALALWMLTSEVDRKA
jgi:uncharacterized membrane protein YphA (DoxX/SURF4 family)